MAAKDYKRWMPKKAEINSRKVRAAFKERGVFWVSVGENVGFEEDGKGTYFNRPVVIVKKFSKNMFWGVPLSTTSRRGRYYHPITVTGKLSVALLSQARTFDATRLANKIGMLDVEEFDELRNKLSKVLLEKVSPSDKISGAIPKEFVG